MKDNRSKVARSKLRLAKKYVKEGDSGEVTICLDVAIREAHRDGDFDAYHQARRLGANYFGKIAMQSASLAISFITGPDGVGNYVIDPHVRNQIAEVNSLLEKLVFITTTRSELARKRKARNELEKLVGDLKK